MLHLISNLIYITFYDSDQIQVQQQMKRRNVNMSARAARGEDDETNGRMMHAGMKGQVRTVMRAVGG